MKKASSTPAELRHVFHADVKNRIVAEIDKDLTKHPVQWLDVFRRRFFANQFKRSALPNGPKISSGGSLSPRGDWRCPSDANAGVWLADLDRIPIE